MAAPAAWSTLTLRTGSAETEGARERADSHSRKTTGYEPHTRDEQKIRIAPTAGHMQGIRYGQASLREKSGGRGGGGRAVRWLLYPAPCTRHVSQVAGVTHIRVTFWCVGALDVLVDIRSPPLGGISHLAKHLFCQKDMWQMKALAKGLHLRPPPSEVLVPAGESERERERERERKRGARERQRQRERRCRHDVPCTQRPSLGGS